jgi:hypothetical protein
MADRRYGNRNRSSSIFSDDDRETRWRGEDDRGFFSKAGDELRSWFGDGEAERRREEDARRWEREHGESGGYRGGGHEDQWRSGPPKDEGRSYERSRMAGYGAGAASGRGHYGSERDYGRAGQGGGQAYGGQRFAGSPHDESYRRWRAQQIEALDREYDEYCRHRQEQFDQDFGSFRQSRGSRGSDSGMSAAATTTGAGDASAATASTGSSNPDAEGTSGKAR